MLDGDLGAARSRRPRPTQDRQGHTAASIGRDVQIPLDDAKAAHAHGPRAQVALPEPAAAAVLLGRSEAL
eukprot:1050884-Prymnesium_polylepis.1